MARLSRRRTRMGAFTRKSFRNAKEAESIPEEGAVEEAAVEEMGSGENAVVEAPEEGAVEEKSRVLKEVDHHLAAFYHNTPSALEVDYDVLDEEVVGSGCTGDVRLARCRSDPEKRFAIKTSEIDGLIPGELDLINLEVKILTKVSHSNILQASGVYEDGTAFHIVSPYMPGGHLATPDSLSENQVEVAAQQMVDAVQHLHAEGYVHRDINPRDVLLDSCDDVKLIDFGVSAHWVKHDRPLRLECGTRGFKSPEMLRHLGYTNKTDLWSLGVCIFYLLNGELPFDDTCVPSQDEVDARIESCTGLSSRVKHFLKFLMKVDPSKRSSAEEASVHPWIAGDNSPLALEQWEQLLERVQLKGEVFVAWRSQTKESKSRKSDDELSTFGSCITLQTPRCAGTSGEVKNSGRPKAARWADILSSDDEA